MKVKCAEVFETEPFEVGEVVDEVGKRDFRDVAVLQRNPGEREFERREHVNPPRPEINVDAAQGEVPEIVEGAERVNTAGGAYWLYLQPVRK